MAVTWNWKEKLGTVEWKEFEPHVEVNVYRGNCLFVMIFEYEEEKVEKYLFCGFMNDIDHLKRCIGLEENIHEEMNNIYKDVWGKWKLNTYYKESIKIAEILSIAGFPVELYYEEIKK